MWLQKAEKEAAAAAVVQTTGADDKGKAPIPAQVTNGARNIKNLCCCQLPVCMAKFPPDTSILCAEELLSCVHLAVLGSASNQSCAVLLSGALNVHFDVIAITSVTTHCQKSPVESSLASAAVVTRFAAFIHRLHLCSSCNVKSNQCASCRLQALANLQHPRRAKALQYQQYRRPRRPPNQPQRWPSRLLLLKP